MPTKKSNSAETEDLEFLIQVDGKAAEPQRRARPVPSETMTIVRTNTDA